MKESKCEQSSCGREEDIQRMKAVLFGDGDEKPGFAGRLYKIEFRLGIILAFVGLIAAGVAVDFLHRVLQNANTVTRGSSSTLQPYSVQDVAAYLHRPETEIIQLADAGEIDCAFKDSGRWKFRRPEADSWMMKRLQKTKTP